MSLDTSHMKDIGYGSTRKAYLSSRGTVYKIVNDDDVIDQNKNEIFLSGKSPILARIINHASDKSWVEMEKLDTRKTSILKAWKKVGISHDDLIAFEFRTKDSDFVEFLKTNKIMIELVRLYKKFNLQDIAEITNWGVDVSGYPKLLDYGYIGDKK